jgi:NAD(P)H-dependent FMN reductase
MFKLEVIITSTRPQRVGLPIGQWFYDHAVKHGKFEVGFTDLKEINLPVFNEPKHPRLQEYEYQQTKDWSARVDQADAFVFVIPEYNHAMPPAMLNALDYLQKEWNYKAAGFVSYGGVSAGTRSWVMARQVLTSFKVMPIPEAVNIPFVGQLMKEGVFQATNAHTDPANVMLDELHKWTGALKPLRG